MNPTDAKTVLDFIESVEITDYEVECVDSCGGIGADSHEPECRWMRARDIMRAELGIDTLKRGDKVISHRDGPTGEVLQANEAKGVLVQWPPSGGEYVRPCWQERKRLRLA